MESYLGKIVYFYDCGKLLSGKIIKLYKKNEKPYAAKVEVKSNDWRINGVYKLSEEQINNEIMKEI